MLAYTGIYFFAYTSMIFLCLNNIWFYFVGNTTSIHILESLCNLDEIIRSIKLCNLVGL